MSGGRISNRRESTVWSGAKAPGAPVPYARCRQFERSPSTEARCRVRERALAVHLLRIKPGQPDRPSEDDRKKQLNVPKGALFFKQLRWCSIARGGGQESRPHRGIHRMSQAKTAPADSEPVCPDIPKHNARDEGSAARDAQRTCSNAHRQSRAWAAEVSCPTQGATRSRIVPSSTPEPVPGKQTVVGAVGAVDAIGATGAAFHTRRRGCDDVLEHEAEPGMPVSTSLMQRLTSWLASLLRLRRRSPSWTSRERAGSPSKPRARQSRRPVSPGYRQSVHWCTLTRLHHVGCGQNISVSSKAVVPAERNLAAFDQGVSALSQS